jgi:biopolymer transport protein ExbB
MDTAPSSLGFSHFLAQADGLAQTVLVVLLLASLVSWYLLLTKAITNWRAQRRGARFLDLFGDAPSLDAVAAHLANRAPDEPFSHLAQQGIAAARHHEHHGGTRLRDSGAAADFVTRALRRTIDDERAKLESGLTILASIGSTAPFVGLLGTVWGIYRALIAIGMSGAGTLDKVAGPVGEALVMTALGLAVAIPAVLGYNFIVRANRLTLGRLDAFAHDLYTLLETGAKIRASTGVSQSIAPLKPVPRGA